MKDTFIGFTDPDTGKTYTYMQDVTKSMCASNQIPIGTEWQLRDKRDEKIYWVAKMSDGLCWMTQNLDLDLTTSGLTSELSDVSSNWNQSSTTVTKPAATIHASAATGWTTTVSSWTGTDATTVRSYNPGVYIFANGTTVPTNGDKQIQDDIMTTEWLFTPTQVGLDDTWTVTYDASFVNATEYDALNGAKICKKTKGSMVGESDYVPCRIYYARYLTGGAQYDMHHLVGNYYSFNAATAGSGKNKTTDDTTGSNPAADSICPKGWKLPLSGSANTLSNTAAPGSFGLMLNKQNIANDANGRKNILLSPLYFVYGGNVNNGSLSGAGSEGRYWSSTASSATHAYALYFNSSIIRPDSVSTNYNDSYRYLGFSVRCVAR